jgi:hypothetical protein
VSNADELPELLNAVFDLPVDWDFSSSNVEIPLEILKEFSKLANIIASQTGDARYHAAISFLWSTRRYVGIDKYNSREFVGSEISAEASKRIMELLQLHAPMAANPLAPIARSGPSLSALLLNKDRELIFELFLKRERLVLRRWGLNQQSVEIVVDRLRRYEFQIFLNLVRGGAVNSDRIGQASLTLQTLSKVPVAAYADGKRGAKARSSLRANLVQSKDKIIGISTLFGDASPLVMGVGIDVSSFISTAAGATAMALLPRGAAR